MTKCPLCQSQLISTQPAPKSMRCPNSYKGDGHLFEFLCYEDGTEYHGEVHHYTYNLLGWQINFWPPNPKYPESKPHLVIRYAKHLNDIIYAGPTKKDFSDVAQVKDYLKLLNLFS